MTLRFARILTRYSSVAVVLVPDACHINRSRCWCAMQAQAPFQASMRCTSSYTHQW
jgi:hypothetical protein